MAGKIFTGKLAATAVRCKKEKIAWHAVKH
jgi:hypothetical protein